MVKAAESIPRTSKGEIDLAGWIHELADSARQLDVELIRCALDLVSSLSEGSSEFLEEGLELANLVASLNMDSQSIAAALVYRPLRTRSITAETISSQVDSDVAALATAVAKLADTNLLEMTNAKMQTLESRDQVENIKRMLVSMVDDARVAILKLAERVVALRSAKSASEERRRRIAQEAHLVFAPLANRLGVWQLKWELEDMALRYLAPDIYITLAKQLDGRRVEREREVTEIAHTVESRLRDRGIDATVSGRAKHIYSIWRKMRSKNVGIDQVYDVRAIRVLVPDIAQCYATLGVIHTQWQHIPSEFDDYIALPKENGYRSIHTAVRWDDEKTLEVQIRTSDMHSEAELGVCAHWAYKGDVEEDQFYNQKMNWLREVVEWQEESKEKTRSEPIGMELRERVKEERIFVYTPKGHVLDLVTDATPVDFAYRVHTEVGHRCKGAKVDGRLVALNAPLHSGDRVEIITSDVEVPQRVWLERHLEFVKTSRARDKIEEWFRSRSSQVNEFEGERLYLQILQRLAIATPHEGELAQVAANLGYQDIPTFYRALAVGDCQSMDLLELLLGTRRELTQMSLIPTASERASENYTIEVMAQDRPGLLFDIASYLEQHGMTLISNSGRVDPETAVASVILEVGFQSIIEFVHVMDGLMQIPSVLLTRRIESTISSGATL